MWHRRISGLFLFLACASPVGLAGCRSGPSGPGAPNNNPGAPGGGRSFVQRHPLFAEPEHYYEVGGPNVFTKVPSAVLVGVPVGVVKEGWHIINGQ